MSIMKMTMLGLENGLKPTNESIFDLLTLPDGINKDDLVDNIILEGGEFEVLYADPHFFRQAVYTWSRKHYRTFEKWVAALNIEYHPLENYDRMEEWTDTGKEVSNKKNNDSMSSNGTNNVDETVKEHDKTDTNTVTENTVSAYDSSSYQPADKTEVDDSVDRNDNIDRTSKANNTNKTTSTGNEDYTKDNNGKHVGRVHGNVGVTTSQTMLQSELDIARFSIIQQITDLFLTEFTLMVYT